MPKCPPSRNTCHQGSTALPARLLLQATMITPESEPHVPQAPVPEARKRDPGTVTRLDGGPATTVRDSGRWRNPAPQAGIRSPGWGCDCNARTQS